ncbi:phosphoribosylamine--glycine ligase, partial [Candidatus Roizmanbacteria bacterium CG_4_10_14_0_2_um_filter_33_96]
MKILIIGSGGREHALGWKIKQSPLVSKIYFAPGNPGTKQIGKNVSIEVTNIQRLLKFAKGKKIDLTVVGPET